MTISSMDVFIMRGSLSSGEYPLVTGYENSVYTIPRVKHAKGLQTQIDIPLSGYPRIYECNVARMDNEYYWITSIREKTAENGQVTMTLDYMGPTSLLRANDTVTGNWHKIPTFTCQYLKDSVTNDIMEINEVLTPTTLDCPYRSSVVPTYWIQVSGYDTNNILQMYGCFVCYNKETDNSLVNIRAYYDADHGYPLLSEILGNITGCCGLLAENVIDISISKRCPFKCSRWNYQGIIYHMGLNDTNTTTEEPTITGTLGRYMYDVGPSKVDYWIKQEQTLTMDLTYFEKACGQLCVRDWNDNTVMEIPTSYPGLSVDVTFQVISDVNGLYLKISHDNQTMLLPEGHLPFKGSNWETYKAYQMDTDRMILENALYNARETRDTQMISGTVNGAINGISTGIMTGVMGGNVAGAAVGIITGAAGVGVSLWEQSRAYDLAELNANFNNELSKKQAISKPESSYNPGYGLIYMYLNEKIGLRLCLMRPATVSQAYYNAWIANYGYPAEGVFDVTIQTGYYQGQLLNTGSMVGQQWDRMNEVFMKGFKFVSP